MDFKPESASLSFCKADPKVLVQLPSKYVLLIPGCSPAHPYKRWPAEFYRQLALKLGKEKIYSVVLGTNAEKQEIDTSFGQRLSWRYFSYVKQHSIIQWHAPTHILYGAKDTLTARETITSFAKQVQATLTIMENGEHWFHTQQQMTFLDNWLKQHL